MATSVRSLFAVVLCAMLQILSACRTPGMRAVRPTFKDKPCDASLAAVATCGDVSVPEDYAKPDGRRIDLNVVVFRALTPGAGRAAQFDLEGGPGFAVTESAGFYATDGVAYRQSRDVVLADMRGTSGSHPLRCEAIERYAGSTPAGPLYPPDLVAACATTLSATSDLRQYATAAAARDIDAVREAFGYEQVDLNALSYGTTLALRYIDDYPQRVRTAVLTGTIAAERTPPRYHAIAGERGLHRLIASCRADAACATRFPDPAADLQRALARLDAPTRARFMEKIRASLYLPASARRVPSILHKAAAGDFAFLDAPASATRPFADGLYLSITCSESLARMDADRAIADADTTVFGAYRLRRQREACARWPTAPRDPRLFSAVRSDVPVLFLSGALDPVTPPEWTREVAARFAHGTHIVVPQGGHVLEGMSGMETCIDPMILRFVADRSAAHVDRSCIDAMSAGAFAQ